MYLIIIEVFSIGRNIIKYTDTFNTSNKFQSNKLVKLDHLSKINFKKHKP